MTDYIHVQTEDPGAVGAMHEWRNPSTGLCQIRNTSNSAWVSIGNSDVANLGLAPTSGFTASGAITGVSGWASIVSPDFTGTPKKSGINLATVNDITALRTELLTLIDSSVSTSISQYSTQTSLSDRIAIGAGVLNFVSAPTVAQTIPLPTFPSDGVPATEAQCKWIVAPTYLKVIDDVVGDVNNSELKYRNSGDTTDVDPLATRTFCSYVYDDGYPAKNGTKIGYLIIATR